MTCEAEGPPEDDADETVAMLAWNRRAEQEDDGWQPIETAPKDGTEFLIVRHGRESQPSYGVVYWDEPTKAHPDHIWHFVDGGSGEAYHRDFPTHWRPLPTPPKGKG